MKNIGSNVAKAAIKLSMTETREEELKLVEELRKLGIKATAVDIGGNFINIIPKIIERIVVASRRSDVTIECFSHDGVVAGAAREAIVQIHSKASGFNIGGKLSVARQGGHITVCIFVNIGLLHLDEVVMGLGHRSLSSN